MRYPLLILLFVLLSGCIDFSPYEVETGERRLTELNLKKIASLSQGAFTPFKFAVISDSHAYYDDLQDAVAAINQRSDLSFVLHAGDVSESGLLQEYEWTEELLSRLSPPYLTVIGNHDALNNGKQNYAALYGPFDYSFTFNQVKFVALNSNNWEFSDEVPRLEWLQTQLEGYAVYQHQIVLTHINPFDSRFNASLSEQYQGVLRDNYVSLVATGHGHDYRYWEEILSTGKTIGFLINGAINRRSYTVVSVEADEVLLQRVEF